LIPSAILLFQIGLLQKSFKFDKSMAKARQIARAFLGSRQLPDWLFCIAGTVKNRTDCDF